MNRLEAKLMVSHPGTQHAPHVAAALHRADLLDEFITGYTYRANAWPERMVHLFRRFGLAKIESRLQRRYFPEIPPEKQRRLLAVTATGAALRKWSGDGDYRRSDRLFDLSVSKRLRRRPRDLYGFHNSCGQSGRAAKEQGRRFFLDMPIGHPRAAQKLVADEFARWGITAQDSDLWFPVNDAYFAEIAEEFTHADLVFAGSDFVRDTLLEAGIPTEKIVVNPYGVDVETFAPARKDPVAGRKLRLICAGQVGIRKGTPDLLHALRKLGDRVECHLCGHYNLPEALKPIWPDNTTYLGAVDRARVAREMAWADVFVFPTLFEGSSLASYEALASGLPVVTTPNCGSIVRHGREGFIVPIRSPDRLIEAISEFLANPGLAEEMGHAARRRAEAHTWAHYGARLLEHIRSVPNSGVRP